MIHVKLRGFLASRYCAAGFCVRIGRRQPAADAWAAAAGTRWAAFVGADNPAARRLPEGLNRRRRQALAAAARRLPTCPGWGGTARWQEQNLLLAADPRRAAMLGRQFGQAALVLLGRRQPARLIWLGRFGVQGRQMGHLPSPPPVRSTAQPPNG